jgi:drug/metabolite transporter (DMT)-like permease
MNTEATDRHPPRGLILAAFATVYVVWGSTYLGMRVAIETIPPFLMAGCRFLIAGGLLLAVLRLRGAAWPEARQWRNAAIGGFLLLVTGNGLVVWAEQTVPSGLASLLVAVAPAWFALIDWFRPGGRRPSLRTVAGILVGFAGVTMLVWRPGAPSSISDPSAWGIVALIVASISWAGGSIFAKHSTPAGSPWMSAALQMLCGGAMLALLSVPTGEYHRVEWSRISGRSVAAMAYLIVFGSWIGYSAYVWLLKVCKPAHVATYAYVNPVIAIFLGNLLLGEPLSARVFAAAAVILAGVVIITLPNGSLSRKRGPLGYRLKVEG